MELVNKYYATVFSLNDSPAERKEAMQTFSVEHGAKCVENVEKMISMYPDPESSFKKFKKREKFIQN